MVENEGREKFSENVDRPWYLGPIIVYLVILLGFVDLAGHDDGVDLGDGLKKYDNAKAYDGYFDRYF